MILHGDTQWTFDLTFEISATPENESLVQRAFTDYKEWMHYFYIAIGQMRLEKRTSSTQTQICFSRPIYQPPARLFRRNYNADVSELVSL